MGDQKALELEHAKKRLYFERMTWVLFSIYVAMTILVWEDKLNVILGLSGIIAIGITWRHTSKKIFDDLKEIEEEIREI